jgi:signal transduction histidine kinase
MIYSERDKRDSAVTYYKRALSLKYDLKDWLGVSSVCNNLASVYRQLGEIDSSLHYVEVGLKVAQERELPRNIWKLEYNRAMGLQAKGDFKAAFDALDLSRQQYTAYFENESQKNIQRLKVLHELDKKDSRIRELQQEKQIAALEVERKQWQLVTLVGGFILLVILGILVYANLRKAEKNKLQQAVFGEKQRSLESVLEATEHERERIGKELHDGIGQQLLAIKQGYNKLKIALDGNANNKDLKTSEYSRLIESTIQDVRNISHQMAPRVLDEKGLIAAIEFILNLGSPDHLEAKLEYFGLEDRYEKSIELTIYRSIQEFLKNTIRHAEATEFSVQIIGQNDAIVVHVSDNGRGIPKDKMEKGLGLQSIQSRANALNGSLSVSSEPGKGTHISLRIPL